MQSASSWPCCPNRLMLLCNYPNLKEFQWWATWFLCLTHCKSLSFFPPLIKQQRLLSSSAKGAQSWETEQNRRAGRRKPGWGCWSQSTASVFPQAVAALIKYLRIVALIWDQFASEDAFIVLWPGVNSHPPLVLISQNTRLKAALLPVFYIETDILSAEIVVQSMVAQWNFVNNMCNSPTPWRGKCRVNSGRVT